MQVQLIPYVYSGVGPQGGRRGGFWHCVVVISLLDSTSYRYTHTARVGISLRKEQPLTQAALCLSPDAHLWARTKKKKKGPRLRTFHIASIITAIIYDSNITLHLGFCICITQDLPLLTVRSLCSFSRLFRSYAFRWVPCITFVCVRWHNAV